MELTTYTLSTDQFDLISLAAIWTEERIPVGGGANKRWIEPGDSVAVRANTLVTEHPNPSLTHIITGCFGTIDSRVLILELECIETGAIIKMRIK
jgi:hypothetical protein